MLICICKNVNSDKLIESSKNNNSFSDVCRETRVGTQCGKCKNFARQLFNDVKNNNN